MKLKKGSAAAKAFMAKLRAAKGNLKPKLKVSAKLKSHTLGAVKKAAPKKKAVKREYVVVLGQRVLKGSKAHANLLYTIKHHNDLMKYEIGSPKKKAAPKKKAPAKSYHKDTKSHNVKIHVVSGVHMGRDMYAIRDSIEKTISQNLRLIELAKNDKSLTKPIKAKMLKTYRTNLASYKKMLREQNRLISSNLK